MHNAICRQSWSPRPTLFYRFQPEPNYMHVKYRKQFDLIDMNSIFNLLVNYLDNVFFHSLLVGGMCALRILWRVCVTDKSRCDWFRYCMLCWVGYRRICSACDTVHHSHTDITRLPGTYMSIQCHNTVGVYRHSPFCTQPFAGRHWSGQLSSAKATENISLNDDDIVSHWFGRLSSSTLHFIFNSFIILIFHRIFIAELWN